jgi:PAS domain S-box-containing protein
MECHADAVIITVNGQIEFVNTATEVLFGRSAQELLHTELGMPSVSGEETEVVIINKNGTHSLASMRVLDMMWQGRESLLIVFRGKATVTQQPDAVEERARHRTRQLLVELARAHQSHPDILCQDTLLEVIKCLEQRLLQAEVISLEMPMVLRRLGLVVDVSRVRLFSISIDSDGSLDVVLHTQWQEPLHCPDPAPPMCPHTDDLAILFGRWRDVFRQGIPIHGKTCTFTYLEERILEDHGIQSLVALPIFVQGTWWGILTFEDCRYGRTWMLHEADSLRAAATMIGTTMQREQVEWALQKSKQRFDIIANYTYDWEYWVSPEGKLLYVSPSCEHITGYLPDDFSRDPTLRYQIISPNEPDSLREEIRQEGTRETPFEATFRILSKQGEERWIRHVSRPVYDHHTGSSLGIRGSNRDITEHKWKEDTYRVLVEQSLQGMIIMQDNRIVFANPALENITGYPVEELHAYDNTAWPHIIHPDDREFILQRYTKRLAGESVPTQYQCRITHKSGSTHWVEVFVSQTQFHGKPAVQIVLIDITERKHAEESLRESEQRFRGFFEQSWDGLVLINQEGTITEWNSAAEQVTSITREEAIGKPRWDVLYAVAPEEERIPETYESLKSKILHLLHDHPEDPPPSQLQERTLQRTDGSRCIVQSLIFPIKSEGKRLMFGGIMRDITKSIEMQRALQENEQRFRFLTENVPDILFRYRFKPTLEYEYVSPAVTAILGYTPEEYYADPFLHERTYHPVDIELIQCPVTMPEVDYEKPMKLRYLHKDGHEVWVEQRVWPIFDEEGEMFAIEGIARDITEQKHAEEAFTQSEQRFQLLAENAQDIIFWYKFEPTPHYAYVSPSVTTILGYTPEECYNDPLLFIKILHPDSRVVFDTYRHHPDSITESITSHAIRKDGSDVWLEQHHWLIYDHNQKPVAMQGIIRDVTQRQRFEEALRQARDAAEHAARAKSEFLANMSHEIRTPLNAIVGLTTLLTSTNLSAKQYDFIKTIRTSSDTLLTLINDILDLSKIEADKIVLEYEPLHLVNCIEETIELVATKATEKNIQLIYIIDDETPLLFLGDATRIRQIVVNLLSNAVKFTEKGEVVVSVSSDPHPETPSSNQKHPGQGRQSSSYPLGPIYTVHIAVRDTGIGIPQGAMNRIFRSFSQVDASTTRKYGGTGLGLTISRRLATIMGGDIDVQSEVGTGSTFTFSVPLHVLPLDREYENISTLDKRKPAPQFADKTILVVDDNQTNCSMVAKRAVSWQMIVHATSQCEQALAWLREGKTFDFIILNLHNIEMDGLPLAAAIHTYPNAARYPIIIYMAMQHYGEASRTIHLSHAVLRPRPIKLTDLYDVLMALITHTPLETPSMKTGHTPDPLGQEWPLSILLAEDNPVNQKVTLLLLEHLGYQADVACNGLEVLYALQHRSYDLIFMDVQMPEMDGIETSRRIRESTAADHQPWIIAMTAHTLEGDREWCLSSGMMNDYLSKPVQMEALIAAIEQLITRKKTQKKDTLVPTHEQAHGQLQGGAESHSSTNHSSPIDFSIIERIESQVGRTGKKLVDELIDIFLKDAPNRFAAMHEGIERNEPDILQQAAHTLKSSSAQLGATHLSLRCKELETKGREGNLTNADTLVEHAEAELARVEAALREYQASPVPGEASV